MKFFRTFIFPGVYGLLIYFTIRLLHDTAFHQAFWHRSWELNGVEMGASAGVGYVTVLLFRYLLRRFDRQGDGLRLSGNRVLRELLVFAGCNLLLINATLIPFVASTDDGLSADDFVDVNVVCSLFGVIYYGIARSRRFLAAYIDNKVQLERVTNQQLETELKFLKAQYHPHFLFNAINTVYFQMDEDVQGAKQTLEKFSQLLRYQLYDQQQQVLLAQEIDYLKSFIDIQKIRSSSALQLDVKIDESLQGEAVYPLLLLPLVENAFKYVGGDYQLHIHLKRLAANELWFLVVNSLPDTPVETARGGGIGLENLRRRLAILYPNRHQLAIDQRPDSFRAVLMLKLENG